MLNYLGRYNHWLIFALACLISVVTLSLTYLWAPSGTTLAGMTGNSGFSLFGNYQSPDRCRECHQAEYKAWAGTTHAEASFDPIFQVYLQAAEKPGECFACHATGYDTATGQFVLAGVSCEACHGPYRPQHPQESMAVAGSEDLCGACHTSTLAEWRLSHHGNAGITCVDCHEVHTQKTHETVVTNALCAGCHHDRTQDQTHRRHIEENVLCVDCHLSRPVNQDVGSAVSGHAVTGHSFMVVPSTCSNCHEDNVPALSSQDQQ